MRGADSGGERGGPRARSKQDNARAVPVIAFFNQKGGTAKTTSTLNVGAALAERGRRTSRHRSRPAGELTMALGVDVLTLELSSYDLLVDDASRSRMSCMPTTIPGSPSCPATRTSPPPSCNSSMPSNGSAPSPAS